MPGPNLELKLYKTWDDIGGCDCWIGCFWNPREQWWAGFHTRKDLDSWSWPDDSWTLVGHERWCQPVTSRSKLLEAFYNTPNPSSTRPPLPAPNGHWHMCWSHRGREAWCQYHDTPAEEESQPYLKGGRMGPKGEFRTKGKSTKGKGTNRKSSSQ